MIILCETQCISDSCRTRVFFKIWNIGVSTNPCGVPFLSFPSLFPSTFTFPFSFPLPLSLALKVGLLPPLPSPFLPFCFPFLSPFSLLS